MKQAVYGWLRLSYSQIIARTERAGFPAFLRCMAAILLFVGIGVTFGWFFAIPGLVGAVPGFPPMLIDSAVLAVLASFGVFALEAKQFSLSRLLGSVLAISAFFYFTVDLLGHSVAVQQFLPRLNERILSPDQMAHIQLAPATAFSFFLFGAALLALSEQNVATSRLKKIGIIGAVIASFGLIAFMSLVSGVTAGEMESKFLFRISIPAAVCALVMGAVLGGTFWQRTRGGRYFAATSAGVLAAMALVLFFSSLHLAVLAGSEDTLRTRAAIAESYHVVKAVNKIVEAVRKAESGQRGYLLTGNEVYLNAYIAGKNGVEAQLQDASLHRLPSAQFDPLRSLIHAKMQELALTLSVAGNGRTDEALRIVQSNRGLNLMVQIEKQADLISHRLQGELDQRSRANLQAVQQVRRTIIIAFIVATILVFFAALLIRREMQRRARLEQELRIHEHDLELNIAERTRQIERQRLYLLTEIRYREQVERILRKTEGRLETALRFAKTALWTWNLEDNSMIWNGEVSALFQRGADELNTATAFLEIILPEDRTLTAERLKRCQETGADYEDEFRITYPTGEVRWIIGRGQLSRDAAGAPVQMAGVNLDITDLKMVQEDLSDREAWWQILFQSLPTAALLIDPKTACILEVNLACCNLLGQSPDELLKDSAIAAEILSDSGQYPGDSFEAKLKTRLGATIETQITIRRLQSKGRRLLYCLIQDVTKDKQAMRALKQSETQFRQLADAMPQIVWTANAVGHHEYFNARWYEFTGFEPGSLGDAHWRSIVHPDDLPVNVESWRNSLATGEPYIAQYRFWDRSLQEYRWHLTRALPVRSDDQILRWFGTCTDIHQQKAAEEYLEKQVFARTKALQQSLETIQKKEEELRRSLAEKETLLKEVHHRVKNNLQIISSLLRMQGDTMQDASAIAALQDSQQRVLSMALIHERLYGNRKMDRIDFGEYTQALVEELFDSYGTHSQQITSRVNASRVFLNIDQAIPCGLILNELVTNALKYAYPGGQPGEVTVSLSPTGNNEVVLTVSDRGIGLPVGFDWKNSKSLGLPIVELLAKQIGGSLSVHSAGGAEFSIRFSTDLNEAVAA